MTLLLNNEEVDRALTHEDALSATEAILAELGYSPVEVADMREQGALL